MFSPKLVLKVVIKNGIQSRTSTMHPKLGFNALDIFRQNIVKEEDVEEITLWTKEQHLPFFGDEQIIQFLLSCNSIIDDTKKTIKAYLQITNSCDQIFSNKNILRDDLNGYLKVGEICILPERTEDGHMMLLNRIKLADYRRFHIAAYYTVLSMTIDSGLFEYPASGLIVIIDTTGMNWKYMYCLKLGLMSTFAHYLQEGLPVKLHKIYFINATPILYKFMSIIRPFTRSEVMEKMTVIRPEDMDLFYDKFIPRRLLPKDYGGDKPSFQELHEIQTRKFVNLIPYFETEEKQRKSAKQN